MIRQAAAILFVLQSLVAADVVVVNSANWQDAFAASVYAQNKGLPLRFIQDARQVPSLLDEFAAEPPQTVELFGRHDNPVPSLTYRLRQMDLDVRDTAYNDHYELSAILAEKTGAREVIIVRDDFAFDALSARYLAVVRRTPVLYSQGVRGLPQQVREALSQLQPSKIYAVGRLGEGVLAELRRYGEVEAVNGRDEYDTNYIANSLAFGTSKPAQAMLLNGDLLELTILNAKENPFLLVPDVGTYSLVQTSNLINETGLRHLLAIGQAVVAPATFIKDRTGAKVYVKFGTISTAAGGEAMTRQDIEMRLEGYKLPQPQYSGRIVRLDADYGKTLGKLTGAVVNDREKPAPPVDFSAGFENTGNIEIPVYVLFRVLDKQGNLLTTLQSPTRAVFPQERSDFTSSWQNPPAEGEYRVEAKFFTDVYSGIDFPGRTLDFDLRWLYVWLFMAILLLALLMLFAVGFQSRRLLADLSDFAAASKRLQAAYADLELKIAQLFK